MDEPNPPVVEEPKPKPVLPKSDGWEVAGWPKPKAGAAVDVAVLPKPKEVGADEVVVVEKLKAGAAVDAVAPKASGCG